ncbi:MAG: protein-methionine-sulfoxide reductase catalytic subunit MsrP [Acidobacteria bacterium]|nr:protein-methionine-sulfoxide reductase catalytic subunit MsrP [Acidobacteriota bacterium]
MLVKKHGDIPYSSVTPKSAYINRRRFLQGTAAGAALMASRPLWDIAAPSAAAQATVRADNARKLKGLVKSPFSTTEKMNSYEDITHYNNYYEFGTDKEQPADLARKLKTTPWTVSVEGEVAKPKTFDIDAIMKMAPLEERICRHRCVEAWSIVVPWIGFSLSTLIQQVEPTSKAKFVAFQSLYDSKIMWSPGRAGIDFPYVEGLRMDEALHPLALLSVGLYGEVLPNQNGAPLRLVLPWKYGFKSIKSIVKIKFQEKMPPTTWNISAPQEYGFYSNVNPAVDHPRWSQDSERRLGEFFRRKTLLFNGYEKEVASLYTGMDLRKNY